MDTPEQNHAPQTDAPSRPSVGKADHRRLGSLLGEDGYEIFNDDKAADLRRLRQQLEDYRG